MELCVECKAFCITHCVYCLKAVCQRYGQWQGSKACSLDHEAKCDPRLRSDRG